MGWHVVTVTTQGTQILLRVEGPLPVPDRTSLGSALNDAGVDPDTVTVAFLPTYELRLDPDQPPTD